MITNHFTASAEATPGLHASLPPRVLHLALPLLPQQLLLQHLLLALLIELESLLPVQLQLLPILILAAELISLRAQLIRLDPLLLLGVSVTLQLT